jgi:hypothetical protein
LQRDHWYPNVNGAVPDQVPVVAWRTLPDAAVPEIAGGAVLAGGAAATAAVGAERALVAPPALEAVTCTTRVAPRSALVGT